MILKPALTVQDQILRLQSKGLIVENPKFAESFLLRNNYYRLNIYFHKFMDGTDHFENGTTFEKITRIYENDQWLRNQLLAILEPIEIHTKTSIAYHLGLKYGSDCFYHDEFHHNIAILNSVKGSFVQEVNHNKQEPFVLHHKQKYDGIFPIWVIVELLSFGAVSKYYSCLYPKDRASIAHQFFVIDEDFFLSWLRSLCVLRNICAHFGYLYKRGFQVTPRLYKEWNVEQKRTQSLFAIFVVIKELSEQQKLENLMGALSEREEKHPSFLLSDYGFPTKWRND